MTLAHPIRRVAIIGAGPSGLAALKYVHLAEARLDPVVHLGFLTSPCWTDIC